MTAQQFQLKALIIGVDKLSPELDKIRKNMAAFRRNLQSFGKGGVEMAAGLGAFVGITSKAFADLEDAGVRLKGALMGFDGAVAPEFAKINELAQELGNQLPGNTADFQNMMTALTQQGVAPRDILDGIGKSAAYLGVQLKLAPEQAAEFAAKMSTATGTAAKDMMSLMDVIQRTASLGVQSDDMLHGFSKLTPVLSMMRINGLDAAKALAPLLAISIRAGMAGESAGNAYRKMIQSTLDAKKVGAANALLSDRGKTLDFTNGKGEFGGMENMFAQLQKLRDLTMVEQQSALKTLFGDDAETLQVVQSMINNGMAGYDAMMAKMTAQADLNMRVAAQLGTLKSLFEAALGNAQNLLAALGETFAPEIKRLTSGLGDLSAGTQDFVKRHGGFIRSLLAIAGVLASVKLAALGLAVGFRLVGMIVAMSPLGMIVTALAVAAGLVIANWTPITAFFTDMWGAITRLFSDGWEGIKLIIGNMTAALAPLRDGFNWVSGKANQLFSSSKNGGGTIAPSLPALAAQSQRVNGDINVNFANAPRGMRVAGAQTNQSGLRLNPDVGYSSFATGMP